MASFEIVFEFISRFTFVCFFFLFSRMLAYYETFLDSCFLQVYQWNSQCRTKHFLSQAITTIHVPLINLAQLKNNI